MMTPNTLSNMPNPPARLLAVERELLSLTDAIHLEAYYSLMSAAGYATLTRHPKAGVAIDLAEEQTELMFKMFRAGILPFTSIEQKDDLCACRTWLDGNCEKQAKATGNPLMLRFAELHAMRFEFLPKEH